MHTWKLPCITTMLGCCPLSSLEEIVKMTLCFLVAHWVYNNDLMVTGWPSYWIYKDTDVLAFKSPYGEADSHSNIFHQSWSFSKEFWCETDLRWWPCPCIYSLRCSWRFRFLLFYELFVCSRYKSKLIINRASFHFKKWLNMKHLWNVTMRSLTLSCVLFSAFTLLASVTCVCSFL